MAASVKLEAMAGIVGDDLLLGFFEMRFHIVTHTDVLLDGIIFFVRNVDGLVLMVSQASGDLLRIPLIGFDLLAGSFGHSGGRKDNTLYTVVGQLVIQGVSQAASLVTAYKTSILTSLFLDPVNGLEYLRIFRLDLNGGVHFVILKGITAKCEICRMDIHPNIGYTCHGDSSLYVVIPTAFVLAL